MKSRCKTFSIAAVVWVSFFSTALAVTAEDIVSRLERREQSITSICGKFSLWAEIRMNDGNMMKLEKQYEWAKKGNMQKLTTEFISQPKINNQEEPNGPAITNTGIMTEKEIRTFDGKITKRLLPDSNSAGIYTGSDLFFLGKVPSEWLLPEIKKKPLSEFLTQDCILKYMGDANIEGQICHLVEFTTSNTNGKLYVADKQGLVPIKYELNIKNPSLPFNTRAEYVFSEFKSYGNVTLPLTVQVAVYRVYPEREELAMMEIFTVEQLEVNSQIPDSAVQLDFPTGTNVNDQIQNKTYTIK